jgi:hypothetical protein
MRQGKKMEPFQTACRGADCGALIWLVPMIKKNGTPGWGPMDPDVEFPNTPPDEWDPRLSHHLTCPNANDFSNRGGRHGRVHDDG